MCGGPLHHVIPPESHFLSSLSVICTPVVRAGAFDQLKQNASKTGIPFFGSHSETDPAVIAQQGCDKFRAAKHDLIIVDTSGRHKQEEALFEEMRQVRDTLCKSNLPG